MAERIDAVAVDMGDGAGGAHLEIAGDQRHADRVPFTERAGGRFDFGRCRSGDHRREAGFAEGAGEEVGDVGLETAHQQRRRDRPHHRAQLRPGGGGNAHRLHVGRARGERRQPGVGRGQRGGEALARHRQLEARLAGRAHARHRGRVLHLLDRRDAGDRLLRERADRVGDGANQPAIDVDRAAAHALGDAGLGERPAFEPRQDQVAPGPLHVLEDAQDVDFEFLKLGPLEDRAPDPGHPGADLADGHDRGRRARVAVVATSAARAIAAAAVRSVICIWTLERALAAALAGCAREQAVGDSIRLILL